MTAADQLEHDRPPGLDETAHAFLRRVTRPLHDAVEAAFERFDLQSRAGLTGFLLAQACVVLPFEQAIDDVDVASVLPDWPRRRRSAALLEDLTTIEASPPTLAPITLPSLPSALGALYVLEGSRLGGSVLHRRVQASGDAVVRAASTFLGHRIERGWPTFLAALDRFGENQDNRSGLEAGAAIVFAAFRSAAEQADRLQKMVPESIAACESSRQRGFELPAPKPYHARMPMGADADCLHQ